jgi:Type IV secretion system pilin
MKQYHYLFLSAVLFVSFFLANTPSAQAQLPSSANSNGEVVVPDRVTSAQSNANGKRGSDLIKCGRLAQTEDGSGEECDFNDLITLVGAVVKFLIFNIITPLLILGLLYFGCRLVVMKDKAAERTKIKNGLLSMAIGLFFMLASWLLVEAITQFFGVRFSSDPKTGVFKAVDFKEASSNGVSR